MFYLTIVLMSCVPLFLIWIKRKMMRIKDNSIKAERSKYSCFFKENNLFIQFWF